MQAYRPEIAKYYGPIVIAEDSAAYEAVVSDLFESEMVDLIVKEHGKPPTMENVHPEVREIMKVFPAFAVEYGQLRLNYIPTRITAMDSDLEDMRNLCLSGKYPSALYEDFIALRGPR